MEHQPPSLTTVMALRAVLQQIAAGTGHLLYDDLHPSLQALIDGTQGPEGAAGPQGPAGLDGLQGPAGPEGPEGAPGPQGPQGPTGDKGERGDGFDIDVIYMSAAELHANEATDGFPDGSFALINSDDEDNGSLYVKREHVYLFQSKLVGVRGDAGPQGAAGLPGLRGKGISFKGSKPNEGSLPTTGTEGDAYWVADRMYVWSDDPVEIVVPGFVRGPALTGPQGPQGPQGPEGLAGPEGPRGPQGVQGIRGPEGSSPDIGQAMLLTEAQTIKEAINEVFTSGNNVKRDTVNALLSIDPTVTVTENSSWAEITAALAAHVCEGGGTPPEINGRVMQEATYPLEDLRFGDFVKKYERGLNTGTSIYVGDTHPNNVNGGVAEIGEDKLLITYAWGASSLMGLRLVSVNNGRIASLGTLNTDTTGNGDYSQLCKLTDEFVVAGYSLGGMNGIQLRLVKITGNVLSFPGAGVNISTVSVSGNGFKMLRVSDNRVLVMYVNGTTQSISVFTFNTGTGAFTRDFTFTSANNVRNAMEVLELDRTDTEIIMFIALQSAEGGLWHQTLRYNFITNAIVRVGSITQFPLVTESQNNAGRHNKLYRFYDASGNIIVGIIYNNPGSANAMQYGEYTINKTTYEIVAGSRRVQLIVSDPGSGSYNTTTVGYGTNNHLAFPFSHEELILVWRNNANVIRCGIFNRRTMQVRESFTLRTGVNVPYYMLAGKTKNHNFIIGGSNGPIVSGLRRNEFWSFHPLTHVRKALGADTIFGVVTAPGIHPAKTEVTIPPL